MEYIYGAMLLHKAGKQINEANVKKVLDAAGVALDEGKIKALCAALKDINIEEAIKQASVPVVQAGPVQAQAQEKKEEKKDEKKSAEEASAGLASLFG
mgnify:CR=1 FL=1